MRVLVVWCPDWAVVASLSDGDVAGGDASPTTMPVAVLAHNVVVACNGEARQNGIRRGMRRRDAQSRCPELMLLPDNPDRDARAFEPVLAAVEELRPGVAPLRPGLLAIRAPGRFYGGEENAAAVIAERIVELGVWDVRVGIADDLFTAEQAARHAEVQGWQVVPVGASASFLRDVPVTVIDDADLVGLLQRLGIRTLGMFAQLPPADVLARFGAYGAKVHRLARGADPVEPATRVPPPDLVASAQFEPPLASVEAVCFSVRRTAEQLVEGLLARGLVCTAVRIEAEGDDAAGTLLSARTWVHSRWFGAADLVDRVHWQLQAQPDGMMVGAPVGLVRFAPETVEPVAAHAEGLWGGTDERVDRGVARVQALLGYDAVLAPVRQGGRAPVDRQRLVPWGERPTGLRPVDQPWPGQIPPPAPSRVFSEPWESTVVDSNRRPVSVTARGVVTGEPSRFQTGAAPGWQRVHSWAGPWPVDEQWWSMEGSVGADGSDGSVAAVPTARFQMVGIDGRAWLMRCSGGQWWTEAAYE